MSRMEDHGALKPWRLELLRRRAGRHSEILHYQSLERANAVIVKRITFSSKPGQAEATVLREYESLQMVRKHLPPELLETVPKPLMVLPDSKAIVLEPMSGTPLSLILKREANRLIGPMRRRRMSFLGRLIGSWLGQLHQATRADPLQHDSRSFLAELERHLVICHGLTVDASARVWRLMSDASHEIEGHPVSAAACQGDFIPQNMLIDENRLGVVDFEAFVQRDSIYEDVATFIAYVQALSTFPYYSRIALETLANSFLQAYGMAHNERVLKLYLARALVVLISEMNLSRAVLYGQRRLRLLQAQLHNVCGELEKTACAA